MASENVISAENLFFSYDSKIIFEGFRLKLAAGEKVAVIGPNGSGKSTLLRLLVGLQKPQAGEIILFGKPCMVEKEFAIARKSIGFQFQDTDDQLFCPTVREDIAFGPLNLGKTKLEALEIVKETLEMVGMQGFEHRITHHLSEGEKKLISLATILAMKPRILLLDEPDSGLDNEAILRITSLLKKHNSATIAVSHSIDFLEQFCSRTIELRTI